MYAIHRSVRSGRHLQYEGQTGPLTDIWDVFFFMFWIFNSRIYLRRYYLFMTIFVHNIFFKDAFVESFYGFSLRDIFNEY